MGKIPKIFYQTMHTKEEWSADENSLQEYLNQTNWLDPYKLEKTGKLFIHWSDSGDGVEQVGLRPSNLQFESIWLFENGKAHQINYADLYLSYAEGKLPSEAPTISFIGPQGPFEILAWSELFSRKDYQLFLLHRIIGQELSPRNFRLHFESSMMASYGESLLEKTIVTFKQLTSRGILFECQNENLKSYFGRPSFFALWPKTEIKMGFNANLLKDFYKEISSIEGSLLFDPMLKNKIQVQTENIISCFGVFNQNNLFFVPYSAMDSELFLDFFEWVKKMVHHQKTGS